MVTYTVDYAMRSVELVNQIASVRGFMASSEQRAFMYHLGMASVRALEIGTYCGMSAVLVGLGMKGAGRYYCLDTFASSNKELDGRDTLAVWTENIQRHGLEQTCAPIQGWSHDDAVYAQVPGSLDFVYVDGDHETDSVLLDALLYRCKLRPDGLLLFHDTPWPTVKAALNRLVQMEMMTVVRVIDDFTVCRTTEHQSAEARKLLDELLAARRAHS